MGDTPGDFLAAMVTVFWKMCRFFAIDIWIGRGRSNLIIADLPTKKVNLLLMVGKTEDFPHRRSFVSPMRGIHTKPIFKKNWRVQKASYGSFFPPTPASLA